MKEFRDIRKNLLDQLEDLGNQLDDIEENKTKPSMQKANSETLHDDHKGYSELENIKEAIARIDQGTYGICLLCGQAMKKEWLNSIPFSNHCQHCTNKKVNKNHEH